MSIAFLKASNPSTGKQSTPSGSRVKHLRLGVSSCENSNFSGGLFFMGYLPSQNFTHSRTKSFVLSSSPRSAAMVAWRMS